MNCHDCESKLLEYADETLEPGLRGELAQHLLGCAGCRAQLEALRLARAHLSQWPEHEVPPALAQQTLAALDEHLDRRAPVKRPAPKREPRAHKLFRPMFTPLAACALLACVGYYAHVSELRVRLGAEVFGGKVFEPESMSVVRLSLFDVDDHAPLADRSVEVALRDAKGMETHLFSGKSDARGQVAARLAVPKLPEGEYQLVVHALDGRDATRVALPVKLARSERLLLSTDKPMYQPGQTIHARVLAFDAATHKPAAGTQVVFDVKDPKGNRIYKVGKPVDGFGAASFDLPLADQLNLGDYTVAATLGDTASTATVQVARYALPKFAVKVELDSPWVRAGQPAKGRVSANYFFGKPVANAQVQLEAGVFIDGFRTVASQVVHTDADGMARFQLDLPRALPGTSLAQGNAVLQLSANVHDAADERVEKHAELIVASEPVAVTVVPENGTIADGVENRLLVLVARPDGQPVANAQVLLDGDGQVARTGDDGVAALDFLPAHGRRDVSVTVVAPEGARVSRTVELTASPSFALVRTDKSLYAAGETVQGSIVATSALKLAYLDVVSEGRTVMTRTVDLAAGKGAFAFELPAEVTGAISLEAYVRHGGELLRTRRIVYAADPRGLKVDVSLDKESHKPGEPAKLRFHVADEHGKPTVAGLGVSVVDESVFALARADPAMLRAFLTLAKELRTPKFSLDAASVLQGGKAQHAADLLFSASKLEPTVSELGHTGDDELSLRRAAMANFKDKRTGTAYFAGLFMLGLMLEGVLRMFAEKLLGFLFTKRFGVLVLGSGVLFVIVDLFAGTREGAVLLSAATLLIGGGILVALDDGRVRWSRAFGYVALLFTLYVATVTLFGDNIRKMFGASVDSLAGSAAPPRATGKLEHQFVRTFAHEAAADEGRVLTKPAAQEDVHEVNQLRKMRQQTIMVIKGSGADAAPTDAVRGLGGEGTGPGGAGEAPGAPGASPKPLSAQQKAQVRVRSFFPETLFWAPEVVTDSKGDATVEVPGADSITTWRAAVTATSADGRLGNGQAALRVFQDFFVDIDMPPLLTVGDTVEIPIAVHNELDAPETVTLEIEKADWLESSAPRDTRLTLAPGEVRGIKYRFTATRFGESQPLTVYAVGPHGKDAIRREVEVRPAGVAFDEVVNGTAAAGAKAEISLPADAFAGASHAELRIYPSTFAAVMDGLENVLRMPSGCFEQTSSATYPNALVLEYLRDQKQGGPELIARAEGYLTTGYQRLLSYEVEGGGFEWFGRAPANQVLTAYGLLEFSDMAKVFPVDEKVIARTQAFLTSKQAYDGSWYADAQSLDDGLYRDDFHGTLTTTAYVTWALAESGYRGEATDRAARYLQSRADASTDAYTVALIANALVDLAPDAAEPALQKLLHGEVQAANGTAYFPAGAQARTAMFAQGTDADVETTALAASALLRAGRGAEAVRALKWLLGARDPHGTWHSTQATVLALRVLLQAASAPGLAESRGTLRVKGPKGEVSLAFTPDQADVVRRVDLTSALGTGPLQLRFEGDAQATYQLELSGYRRPEAESRPALSLALDYDHPVLRVDDTIQARLTATYQRSGASGMVLIQAAVPPGFEPSAQDLQTLVARGQIARFDDDGKTLTFYVDRLQTGKPLVLGYGLKAKYPVRATAPASSAYLYYEPAVRAQSKPLTVTVAGR